MQHNNTSINDHSYKAVIYMQKLHQFWNTPPPLVIAQD